MSAMEPGPPDPEPTGRTPPAGSGARGPVSKLEWAAVALLFAAALIPRARDLGQPFDRHFEGFQGAFFTLGAINYERLGLGAVDGYPVLNVQVEPGSDPSSWYVYPNHPPAVPLLAWTSAVLFGPDGWEQAWREDRAPVGLEPAMRFPFLVAGLVCALTLWWAVREASGVQHALLALAVYAALPLSAGYGMLVNYTQLSLIGVLMAYGWYARWLRGAGPRALVWAGVGFALASSVTYGPAFFVPALALHALFRRGLRGAFLVGAATTVGVLVPLAIHGAWAGSALEGIGRESSSLVGRVGRLVGALGDESMPFGTWLTFQLERCWRLFSGPLCVAAVLGLGWRLATARRRDRDDVALGPPLLLGSFLVLLGFYRHTFDDPPQDPFLLNVTPGAAVLAAAALNALAGPLYRLRGGVGPLVLATGLVVLPALARFEALRRDWRLPGPADGGGPGPDRPLPITAGRQLAELLPPEAAGVYPMELGFNAAVPYYAWRTLAGARRAAESGAGSYEHADAFLHYVGRGDAPRYLVLPKRPPSGAREVVEGVRAEFRTAVGEPELETEHWEGWRLQ